MKNIADLSDVKKWSEAEGEIEKFNYFVNKIPVRGESNSI